MHFRGRGRGGGRGGPRGGPRGGFQKFGESRNESPWVQNVRENRDAVDLEFKNYSGTKKHELPEDFVKLLNEEKTQAKDSNYLLETDLGITEFMTPETCGFTGILKHRYSDFVVHEIDINGKEVKLTDLSLPPKASSEVDDVPEKFMEHSQLDENEKELVSALSWVRILQLAKKCAETTTKDGNSTEHGEVRIDFTTKSKDERKLFHELIRKHFTNLDSSTAVEDEKKFMVLKKKKKPPANVWPRDRPKFLTFHLCKESIDTSQVMGQLSRELGIDNSKLRYAGTKDRRSLSTQKIAIKHVTAEKVIQAVKAIKKTRFGNKQGPKINVGNFTYEKESLELGDLQGNKFTIVLRNVEESQETVEKALMMLKENGFINYFGQQRFGTDSNIKTSDIGLALIKEKWQEAIELILKPRGNESPQLTRMRAHWWMYRNPGDAVVLLGSRMSQSKSIEATLLQGLEREHKNNLVGALGFLQRNTQLLYLHAYQSLLWNKAVSYRIQKFGYQVLIGDLVLLPETKELQDENDIVREECGIEASKWELKEARIQRITEENMDQYTLNDVVMPIPGHKVSYPGNKDLKQIYIDLLEADGLENGFDSLKHSIELYSLPGDYRYIIETPTDVSWKFTRYDDPSKDILVSDMALIEGQKPIDNSETGTHMAVIVEMTLASSTYATMALREAMKIDMNKGSQAKLTEKMNEVIQALKRKNDEETLDESDEPKKAKIEVDDSKVDIQA